MKTRKALSLFFCTVAFVAGAATVSVDTVKLAAGSWALSNASLGVPHGRTVSGATPYDVDGTVGFYAVALEGGGTLFLAADDEIGPVLAFTAESSPDLSAGSPLRALLEKDIRVRRGVAVAVEKEMAARPGAAAASAKPKSAAKAKAMWSMLTASLAADPRLDKASPMDAAVGSAAPVETDAISDMRVEPLVESKWDQDDVGGKGKYCFNYFTPNHLYCGCVATAAAQIMRFWNYPTAALPAFENDCTVLGITETLQSIGYPDDRHYDWDNMTLVPTADTGDAERQAIGRLTADIGIALGAEYTEGGTGAMSIDVSGVFRDQYAYGSGVEFWDDDWDTALQTGSGLHTRGTRNKVIYACLDAGLPVQLAIADGNGANGHAVVCDGYGFVKMGEEDIEFAHINMGWSGAGDMWYNLPEIDSMTGAFAGQGGVDFQIIKGATFNIAPDAFGELLTGRVTDDGEPVGNVTVTAYAAGTENVVDTCVTDDHGIYAFRLPGNASYNVRAVADDGKRKGELDEPVHLGTTGGGYAPYVVNDVDDVGNSWGNDIDIAIPYVRVVVGAETNLFNNLNKALMAAATMDSPVVEVFGPTLLKRPVTIVTNMTVRVVADPDSDYPTMEDCTITIRDAAVTAAGWALQVADGTRVDFSNVVFTAESGNLPYLDVMATGTASVAGKIGIGTVKVQDLDGFVLAGPFEPVGAGLPVEYVAGGTARYSQFGKYECSEEDAVRCASNIVNTLDVTLMGAAGDAAGTLVWDRISANPDIAIAYATDDTIGTTYYLSVDLLFADYTNGAEIVFLRDCPPAMFTNSVIVSKSATISSKAGSTFTVSASKDADFTVVGGAELAVSNVVFTRNIGGSSNFVTLDDGSFVLDAGAVIDGLSLAGTASAVYVNKGRVTMRDGSAITNCVGTQGHKGSGAAVFLKDANGSMDFTGGTITGCRAGTDGGAVCAKTGAKIAISGTASAYGNFKIYNRKDVTNDISVSSSAELVLAGPLSGDVGVSCASGKGVGGKFASVGDGVDGTAAEMACGHFFNDDNPNLYAAVSDDGETLVWASVPPGPQPVPEADAVARLVVGDASETYATLDDALEVAGDADARIELLKDTSLVKSLSVRGETVLDGMGLTIAREGDFCLAATNTTLTITNLVLNGGAGEGRILDVRNGTLVLEGGTTISGVTGSAASMVAPVVVWGGSFVMNSGVEISDCVNSYVRKPGDALTAGAVLVQNAVADLSGGTIAGCSASGVGGVAIVNGAEMRVGGDIKIKGNKLLSGEECNLVVQDQSELVLTDILIGRVGFTEGIGGDTNMFGVIDAEFAASTTPSNLVVSAHRFTNDRTGAKGMVATNETEAILVWSSAIGDSTQFTNITGNASAVYDVVLIEVDDDDPEVVECVPFAFAAIEEVSPGTWKLTLKPGTELCVYTLKTSDDLVNWTQVGDKKTLSSGDINDELEFIFETTPDSGVKRFWKVEGANGIK